MVREAIDTAALAEQLRPVLLRLARELRLETAGLIERVRSTDDRRRVVLRLTPAGAQLSRRVRARRTTWLVERLRELDDHALESIERAIEPLSALLSDDRV